MPTDTSPDSRALATLIDRVSAGPWDSSLAAHERAAAIFGSFDAATLLGALKSELDSVAEIDRSVEKTTHYKWFLDEDPMQRFQVWLHEYKPSTHRREGHATVAHNHRFWLTSLILRGGFTDTRYERPAGSGPESGSISPIESRRMDVGDTMVLDPDEIHALSELRDGTLSLIVQGKPMRSFSEVFEGGEVRRYADLGAKLADLKASL